MRIAALAGILIAYATFAQATVLGIPDDVGNQAAATPTTAATPPAHLTPSLPHVSRNSPPTDDRSLPMGGRRPIQETGTPPELQSSLQATHLIFNTRPPLDQAEQIESSAQDCIRAARVALNAGRIHDAVDQIDQAQTRLLTRTVVYNGTQTPVTDPAINRLLAAKQAVEGNDRMQASLLLDEALGKGK